METVADNIMLQLLLLFSASAETFAGIVINARVRIGSSG